MNIALRLHQTCEQFASGTALDFENDQLTYSQLDRNASAIANILSERGLSKGDRVAFMVPASLTLISSCLACLKLGAIMIPVNHQFKENELLHILKDSEAKAVITNEELMPLLHPIRSQLTDLKEIFLTGELENANHQPSGKNIPLTEMQENDIAAIFYTSGTTGRPKGAALSHQNILSNLHALRHCWECTSDDVLLHTLPLYHVHGFVIALLGSLLSGSKIILKRYFNAEEVLQTIAEKKVTLFMGVPTMYFRMMEAPGHYDFPSMRLFISGSAPLSPELFHKFKMKFGHEILERAGMTETLMNFSNPVHGKRIPGSVGFPLRGVEVRIVNDQFEDQPRNTEGEILLKGPNVFSGYWKNQQATRDSFKDGWFMTGDTGKIDGEGRVFILDRKRDIIKSGGILIFPKEIEEVIEQMPHIKECAVVGIPDEQFGEAIKAFVVTDGNPVSSWEIISFCKSKLASFKKPKQVEFLKELPKNAMGKIMKESLRKMHQQSRDALA